MNDAEWTNLRDVWHREKGQLPPGLQRYARKQSRGLLVANLIFWTIVAGECALAAWLLVHERNPIARLNAWVILGTVSMVGAWFVGAQHRIWPKPFEVPSEMLTRFERQLGRSSASAWIGAGTFFAISLFALAQAAALRGGVANLWSSSRWIVLQVLVALVCVAVWPRWVTRRVRRGRDRINAWRAEMAA